MCSDTLSKICVSVCFAILIVLSFEITVTPMGPVFRCMAHIWERGFQKAGLLYYKISTESGLLTLPQKSILHFCDGN